MRVERVGNWRGRKRDKTNRSGVEGEETGIRTKSKTISPIILESQGWQLTAQVSTTPVIQQTPPQAKDVVSHYPTHTRPTRYMLVG